MKWIFRLYFFLLTSMVFGQEPVYIHFEPEIDIPFSTTYGHIEQDSLGYLWFGTDTGLYRYDGMTFQLIPTSYEIRDIEVLDLTKDKQDVLWYKTYTGDLCKYKPGTDSVQIFSPSGVFDSLKVYTFKYQKDSIFVQLSNTRSRMVYLYSFSSGAVDLKEINLRKAGEDVFYFVFDNKAILVSRCPIQQLDDSYAVCYFEKDKPYRGITNQVLVKNKSGFGTAFSDDELQLIYCLQKNTPVYLFDGHTFKRDESLSKLGLRNYTTVQDSLVNFMTNDGYYVYDYKAGLIRGHKSKGYDTHTVLIDREKASWVGTNQQGLLYYPANTILSYPSGDWVRDNKIVELVVLSDSSLLVVGETRIGFLNTKTLSPIGESKTISDDIIDIAIDRDQLYILSEERIDLYNINRSNHTIKKNTSVKSAYGKILESVNQTSLILPAAFWDISTYDLLDKKWMSMTSPKIVSLYNDKANRKIWFGMLNGVGTMEYDASGNFGSYSIIDGAKGYATKIDSDKHNNIWVATVQDGLFRFSDDSVVANYKFIINGETKKIDHFSCSNSNKIWLSSFLDIYQFDVDTEQYYHEANLSQFIKAPITDMYSRDDTLFIGTQKGLYVYISSDQQLEPNAHIHINQVRIDGRDTSLLDNYQLKHDENNVELLFKTSGAYNPLRPAKIFYRLNDGDWFEAHNKHAIIPNLTSGDYTIFAKAVYDERQEQYHEAQISFYIPKPFWKTIWFYALVASLVVATLFVLFLNNLRRLARKKDQERQADRLKNSILQLQLNPHFIFNSINTIVYYITVSNKEKSIDILTKLSRLIRHVFRFSSKRTITLSEEIGFLLSYLEMEEERFGDKITVNKHIDSELYESELAIPPLLLQPVLENAFKHGLFHRKSGGVLDFVISKQDKAVQVEITDNGVGRELIRPKVQKKYSSYDIIRERIQIINESTNEFGDLRVSFDIIDLIDDQSNAMGTKNLITFDYS